MFFKFFKKRRDAKLSKKYEYMRSDEIALAKKLTQRMCGASLDICPYDEEICDFGCEDFDKARNLVLAGVDFASTTREQTAGNILHLLEKSIESNKFGVVSHGKGAVVVDLETLNKFINFIKDIYKIN